MKLTQIIASATLLGTLAAPVLTTLPAQAATHKPTWTKGAHHTVNARQHRQHVRIERGERKGSLTERESERLEHRTTHIKRVEAHNRRSGGKFTPRERHQVQRDLNHVSHRIYHQKHDAQHR